MKSLLKYTSHTQLENESREDNLNVCLCEDIPEIHYSVNDKYDSRVEYLETTGNCKISIPYIPNTTDLTFKLKMSCSGYTDSTAWIPWFQAYTNENANTYRVIRSSTTNNAIYVNNATKAGGGGTTISNLSLNTDYIIDLWPAYISVNKNITTLGSTRGNTNTGNLYILHEKFKGRVYYFQVYKGTSLIIDLIPVRIGNVGYLYDRISDELYGNSLSGTLILGKDSTIGNELMQIEYLESTGTQWIDTEIIPNSSIGYEIRWQKATSNAVERAPIGAWSLWNSNMWGDDFKEQNTQILVCWGNGYKSISTSSYPATNAVTWKRIGTNFYYNGSVVSTNTAVTFTGTTTATIFGMHIASNGNINYRNPIRIYSVRLFNVINNVEGTTFMDLIPVRKHNIGYLYDKVSGKLFKKSGTGEFVLGPDVKKITYKII